jgi:hypothetical protein
MKHGSNLTCLNLEHDYAYSFYNLKFTKRTCISHPVGDWRVRTYRDFASRAGNQLCAGLFWRRYLVPSSESRHEDSNAASLPRPVQWVP